MRWMAIFGIIAALCFAGYRNYVPGPDGWMAAQIERDLSNFKGKILSKEQIRKIAEDPANDGNLLVHFTIRNNKVSVAHRIPPDFPFAKDHLFPRMNALKNTLQQTLKKYRLPDMEFVASLHDAMHAEFPVPVFVMAKTGKAENQVLIPDFEALRGQYQVLKGQDITEKKAIPAWNERKEQLVWRGGPGQHSPEGYPLSLDPNEFHCLSRIKLCHLSKLHPELIDSRFSYLGAQWSALEPFLGSFLSFEDQVKYKYHMQIDGYSCSYYSSGWKFFTGALVFKEDSNHFQWYYPEMKPYVHYIPVQEGLGDLLEKLQWAREHDKEARKIARQGREFALSHITQEKNRLYYYHALLAYSRLNWSKE